MSKATTPSTYVRNLSHGMHRQLADLLDPQEGWKKIAVNILKPSGEPRYTQFHIRRFEGTVQMGKSPTCELLYDWGTTNCTVLDLTELLKKNGFYAAASFLLPVTDTSTKKVHAPTRPVDAINVPCEISAADLIDSCSPLADQSKEPEENEVDDYDETGIGSYSFNEIKHSTNNFDIRPVSEGGNKLGEGGFGIVFRGKIKGKIVAVKKLTELVDASIQDLTYQFEQEIKIMAKCQHENLVKLLGYSKDGDQYCLVYTYMPHGSLLDRLACLNDTPPISWLLRCNIAYGTANGIRYLHENSHVHRDVKSANILLDDAFVPKISDFGLSRATGQFSKTMMTERIVGTTAYMAPEALRGEITIKSDIFSFGVVLLEIISGLAPVDEDRSPSLLLDIKEEIEEEEKTIEEYMDKKMGEVEPNTLNQMYTVASQCLNQMKNKRPDIKRVLQNLENIKNLVSRS
ncbi:interleukin-1 receptor-associated kinase 4 [Xenopus laevis]|uniref:Interleukin-1 receptor-associated kinase 4 n=2 Tax=Xenopus laevis TaxID=8355 RepID=A0A1L8GYU8_XENLA|nr:interleukin-1 receptor-associated kinase 4 [Xenopus laevis]XP_018108021.1 interleukin-1 receptor-associated kinase 4 [Xenopus laevis]OCT88971.1 hypothetical protein XELAEV_18017600mg [Xenopus laevis]